MLELIILLAAGLLLVGLFVFWALSQWERGVELRPAQVAPLLELVPLLAASHERAERIFDARDYRFLVSQPHLRQTAQQFECHRRETALLWLRLVREDFERLQQFHRTLVRCGARMDARTEWSLLLSVVSFRLFYGLLTVWIRVFGLYAAPRAHTALLGSIRRVSSLLADVLARLSPGQLAEVKQFWPAPESTASFSK